VLCHLSDPRVAEASGIVASAAYDDVFYTHNDSGDVARFFRINGSCRTTATFDLSGVQARDWEDVSRGPGGTLWLGDIGDNSGTRAKGILVHRVAEPGPAGGEQRLRPTSFRLRYPDGPHDAEALLVHPRTGRVLVVTKGFAGATVYAAPLPLNAAGPNVLQEVGRVAVPEVTAGDISPDGSHVVLRNYTAAYEWKVAGDDVAGAFKAEPVRIALPPSPQGEAISYTRNGSSFVVVSEGAGATVEEVDRPAPAAVRRPAPHERSSPWPRRVALAVVAAALLLAVGLVGLHRTRSARSR
jgi:hypothetical protein